MNRGLGTCGRMYLSFDLEQNSLACGRNDRKQGLLIAGLNTLLEMIQIQYSLLGYMDVSPRPDLVTVQAAEVMNNHSKLTDKSMPRNLRNGHCIQTQPVRSPLSPQPHQHLH